MAVQMREGAVKPSRVGQQQEADESPFGYWALKVNFSSRILDIKNNQDAKKRIFG